MLQIASIIANKFAAMVGSLGSVQGEEDSFEAKRPMLVGVAVRTSSRIVERELFVLLCLSLVERPLPMMLSLRRFGVTLFAEEPDSNDDFSSTMPGAVSQRLFGSSSVTPR